MVAGEDSQAARVVGQHLGNAELHREVRDAGRHLHTVVLLLLIPQRTAQVIVQSRPPASRADPGTPRRAPTGRAVTGSPPPAAPPGHSRIAPTAPGRWSRTDPASVLSHDHRRLVDSCSSAARRSGRWARTVNRRRAFTRHYLTEDCGARSASERAFTSVYLGGVTGH